MFYAYQRMFWASACLVAGGLLSAPAAFAQQGAGDGYLFHTPRASLSMRFGVAVPNANQGVFRFTSDLLTVDRSDYTGMTGGVNLDIHLTQRLALEFATAMSYRDIGSEYRDFVDNNDLPIKQRTAYRRVPFTAGAKLFLTPTGRTLSRYAWVPSKFAPYVSGGGGVMYYSFQQSGDFVDFETNDVFKSTLKSNDWTPVVYGAAGFNYSLSARMGLTTEARYDYARATMSNDFQGFPPINVSGVAVTTGLYLRF